MKTKLQVFSSKRKEVKVAFLASLLLVAFTLMPIVFADPETPQNITVETAYSMIDGGSFPDLAILDVRNQSEYDINHLYGAILIPLHELETRIGELGGRSEIASGILADNGFTKVYNMLGGITAWIEAEYPVYTTYHHVTVDITGNKGVHVEIEPLLVQTGCTSCTQNSTCPSNGESVNVTSTVLEQNETHTIILFTIETNDTVFEQILTRTLLWNYSDNTSTANKTASFTLTEIATENTTTQFYTLSYVVQHMEYNLTIATELMPLNTETYNTSSTIMNYRPAGESEVTSLELLEFNDPVTLSQLYTALEKAAKKLGKVYSKSEDPTLAQLAPNYYDMEKEAKNLSWLVNKQLQEYDLVILHSIASIKDSDCVMSAGMICTGLTTILCAIIAAPCGFLYLLCFAGCLAGFGAFCAC